MVSKIYFHLVLISGLVIALVIVPNFAPNSAQELVKDESMTSVEAVEMLAKGESKESDFSYPKPREVRYMEPLYVTDFDNDSNLVGASHNIFVGTVLRTASNIEKANMPQTQFEVKVVENIKGKLEGNVIVNQQGGFKNNVAYLIGEEDKGFNETGLDPYFLVPGSTYLFATRYNLSQNWYTLNPHPAARKLIATNSLEVSLLKNLISSDLRVQALLAAYPKEVLLKADLVNNNARNSFENEQSKNFSENTESSVPVINLPEVPDPNQNEIVIPESSNSESL